MVHESDDPIADPVRIVHDQSGEPTQVKATIKLSPKDALTYSDYNDVVAEGIRKLVESDLQQAPQQMALLGFMLDDSITPSQLYNVVEQMDEFSMDDVFPAAKLVYASKKF